MRDFFPPRLDDDPDDTVDTAEAIDPFDRSDLPPFLVLVPCPVTAIPPTSLPVDPVIVRDSALAQARDLAMSSAFSFFRGPYRTSLANESVEIDSGRVEREVITGRATE